MSFSLGMPSDDTSSRCAYDFTCGPYDLILIFDFISQTIFKKSKTEEVYRKVFCNGHFNAFSAQDCKKILFVFGPCGDVAGPNAKLLNSNFGCNVLEVVFKNQYTHVDIIQKNALCFKNIEENISRAVKEVEEKLRSTGLEDIYKDLVPKDGEGKRFMVIDLKNSSLLAEWLPFLKKGKDISLIFINSNLCTVKLDRSEVNSLNHIFLYDASFFHSFMKNVCDKTNGFPGISIVRNLKELTAKSIAFWLGRLETDNIRIPLLHSDINIICYLAKHCKLLRKSS